jgi:hypothetical protein
LLSTVSSLYIYGFTTSIFCGMSNTLSLHQLRGLQHV